MREAWEDRYKRAVATYAGCPTEVRLSDIQIDVNGYDGAHWSSITFEDPEISVTVTWPNHGFKDISGPEAVASLIRSFLSPDDRCSKCGGPGGVHDPACVVHPMDQNPDEPGFAAGVDGTGYWDSRWGQKPGDPS